MPIINAKKREKFLKEGQSFLKARADFKKAYGKRSKSITWHEYCLTVIKKPFNYVQNRINYVNKHTPVKALINNENAAFLNSVQAIIHPMIPAQQQQADQNYMNVVKPFLNPAPAPHTQEVPENFLQNRSMATAMDVIKAEKPIVNIHSLTPSFEELDEKYTQIIRLIHQYSLSAKDKNQFKVALVHDIMHIDEAKREVVQPQGMLR